MKQKYKLLVSLLTIISMMGVFAKVNVTSSPIPMVYVKPSILYAPLGQSFTVDIRIADVVDLHTWQISLNFSSSVLSFVNVTEGDFLSKGGRETVSLVNLEEVEEGYVLFTWSIKGKFSESGSGILATLEFLVLEEGESMIDITDPDVTILIKMNPPPVPPGGTEMEEIPFTAVDGLFFNVESPPVAEFTYSPSMPGINETITFNASASSAMVPLEIIEYQWDFDDGTTEIYVKNVNLTDTVTHSYVAGGTYNVSLTVVDDFNATGTLIEATYNTTRMPQIWFETYSTAYSVVDVKLSHNIAVTDVKVSDNEVAPGEIVSINVTVLNKGTETENFNVIAYYGDIANETQPVDSLNPGEQKALIFNWDTAGVAEGIYRIRAEATDVEGEGSPQDNTFIDGDVTVKSEEEPFPITLVVVAVVGIVVIAIVVFMYMRRKSAPSA